MLLRILCVLALLQGICARLTRHLSAANLTTTATYANANNTIKAMSGASKHHGNVTVCFHSNQAGERGTEQAVFDYAYFGRKYYHYHSIIIFPHEAALTKNSATSSYKRFEAEFPIHTYKTSGKVAGGRELAKLAESLQCSILYIIKTGTKESEPRYPDSFSPNVLTVVHSVFKWEPQGDAYAAVGNKFDGKQNDLVVPHIIRPPSPPPANKIPRDLRAELHIPKNARTICRHGGSNTFDIEYVHSTILSVLHSHAYSDQELHFIFMNTKEFIPPPSFFSSDKTNYKKQMHFLPAVTGDKEFFFDACDVMLHARSSGETFGIAVAEFSIRNKPVITNNVIEPMEHVRILGSRGFYYHDGESLRKQIDYFVRQRPGNLTGDFNAYHDYYPEVVMRQFHEAFVAGPLAKGKIDLGYGNPGAAEAESLPQEVNYMLDFDYMWNILVLIVVIVGLVYIRRRCTTVATQRL